MKQGIDTTDLLRMGGATWNEVCAVMGNRPDRARNNKLKELNNEQYGDISQDIKQANADEQYRDMAAEVQRQDGVGSKI